MDGCRDNEVVLMHDWSVENLGYQLEIDPVYVHNIIRAFDDSMLCVCTYLKV